jgi:hypothetical protein
MKRLAIFNSAAYGPDTFDGAVAWISTHGQWTNMVNVEWIDPVMEMYALVLELFRSDTTTFNIEIRTYKTWAKEGFTDLGPQDIVKWKLRNATR